MWVLASVILCYVWRVHQLFPVLSSLQLPMLSAGVAVGLYVLDEDGHRRLGNVDGPVVRLLAALAALMVIGAPFALMQGSVFSFFTRDYLPSVVLLTVLTAAAVRSEEDLRWLVGVHLAGATVFSLVVLTRFTVGAGGRLGNLVYYDANDLGMLLVMSIPLALFFVLRGRNAASRLLSAAAVLLFLVVIVKSGSRGAFIGLCAVGAWILLRYRAIPVGRRLAVLAAVVVVLGVWGSDDYWQRMQSLTSPTDDYNWAGQSESGRMEVWKRGIGYMLDRPLLGVGVRNFNRAEGVLSPQGQLNQLGGPGFKWSAAHNAYVQIGAEMGVFGLLVFLSLLFQGFRIAARDPPATSDRGHRTESRALRQALRVCLVGFVVIAFFLSAAYKPVLFALLGLLAGLAKLDRESSEIPEPNATATTLESRTGRYRLVRRDERRVAS